MQTFPFLKSVGQRNVPAQICFVLTILALLQCRYAIASLAGFTKTVPQGTLFHSNVTLGGLFSLHIADKDGEYSPSSLSLNGIKSYEAMLFAVGRINADNTILPNTTLNVKMFDTCQRANVAMDRVLKRFILGTSPTDNNEFLCSSQNPVIGVVGPPTSVEAVDVAKALGVFHIPVISYDATSSELSEKSKYEYFSRTVPSDVFAVKALTDLFKYFNWTYISVVYTDEPYGRVGFDLLKTEGEKHGICIAVGEELPVDYDEDRYKSVINKLVVNNSSKVIVLFCVVGGLVPILTEMQKQISNFERMQLIIPYEVIKDILTYSSTDLRLITTGLISINVLSKRFQEFEDYFSNLKMIENKGKEWFKDYYEHKMNCSLHQKNRNQSRLAEIACDINQTLGSSISSNQAERVIDAVYAFAHALHYMQHNTCGDSSLNCNQPLGTISGESFLHAIRNVSFTSLTGRKVQFNDQGDIKGGYEIYYIGDRKNFTTKYIKIAYWEGTLHMNLTCNWSQKLKSVKSRCSEHCGKHKVQRVIPGEPSCCWSCEECSAHSVILNKTHCHVCEKGYKPDRNMGSCVKIQAIYYTVDRKVLSLSLVLPSLFLSAIGILAVGFTVSVFLRFNNTPLVKASGRELCYLLLLGLFLSYLFPFVCILRPSRFKCFAQFILDSLPTTISYVAIVVKTNRVLRIFDDSRIFTKRPALARSLSQLFLSCGLISFQVLLLLILSIIDFPDKKLVYFSTTEVYLVCSTSKLHLILSEFYNAVLVIACTYYAYKSRNIPKNFNEAKYIAFAMYGSCTIFLAIFVVSASGAQNSNAIQQSAIVCYKNSLMSSVLVTCFFTPKVYIILFKPKENINRPTFNPGQLSSNEETKNEIRMCRHCGMKINEDDYFTIDLKLETIKREEARKTENATVQAEQSAI